MIIEKTFDIGWSSNAGESTSSGCLECINVIYC